MTIQELIDKLQEITDKNKEVFLDNYSINVPVDIIAEYNDCVVFSCENYDEFIAIKSC